jgi:broad specificity phosphatase PhoE
MNTSDSYNNEQIVSVIFTHQHRMKCILNHIFKMSGNRPSQFKEFQNGCILKLIIEKFTGKYDTNKIRLFMKYQGMLDPQENNTMSQYYKGNSVGELLAEIDLSDLELTEGLNFSSFIKAKGKKNRLVSKECTYVFYLIRDAQGIHNLWKKGYFKRLKQHTPGNSYKDTSLTDVGIEQAENTSIHFLNCLKDDFGRRIEEKFNLYVFCSELKRTYQTAALVLNPFNCDNRIKIIVLPCSSEVNSRHSGIPQGECDSGSKYRTNENISLCIDKNNRKNMCCSNQSGGVLSKNIEMDKLKSSSRSKSKSKSKSISSSIKSENRLIDECVPNLFTGAYQNLNNKYKIDWSYYDRIIKTFYLRGTIKFPGSPDEDFEKKFIIALSLILNISTDKIKIRISHGSIIVDYEISGAENELKTLKTKISLLPQNSIVVDGIISEEITEPKSNLCTTDNMINLAFMLIKKNRKSNINILSYNLKGHSDNSNSDNFNSVQENEDSFKSNESSSFKSTKSNENIQENIKHPSSPPEDNPGDPLPPPEKLLGEPMNTGIILPDKVFDKLYGGVIKKYYMNLCEIYFYFIRNINYIYIIIKPLTSDVSDRFIYIKQNYSECPTSFLNIPDINEKDDYIYINDIDYKCIKNGNNIKIEYNHVKLRRFFTDCLTQYSNERGYNLYNLVFDINYIINNDEFTCTASIFVDGISLYNGKNINYFTLTRKTIEDLNKGSKKKYIKKKTKHKDRFKHKSKHKDKLKHKSNHKDKKYKRTKKSKKLKLSQ